MVTLKSPSWTQFTCVTYQIPPNTRSTKQQYLMCHSTYIKYITSTHIKSQQFLIKFFKSTFVLSSFLRNLRRFVLCDWQKLLRFQTQNVKAQFSKQASMPDRSKIKSKTQSKNHAMAFFTCLPNAFLCFKFICGFGWFFFSRCFVSLSFYLFHSTEHMAPAHVSQYIWLKSVKMRYVAKYLFPGNVWHLTICSTVGSVLYKMMLYLCSLGKPRMKHIVFFFGAHYVCLGFHLISIPWWICHSSIYEIKTLTFVSFCVNISAVLLLQNPSMPLWYFP